MYIKKKIKPWLKRYELNSNKEANLELKSQKYDIQLGLKLGTFSSKHYAIKTTPIPPSSITKPKLKI
jgi:hypothetical protein